MTTNKTVNWINFALIFVGALNWGLVGIFNFNLVSTIFGGYTPLTRIVYVLVGIAAVYTLFVYPTWIRKHTHTTTHTN